MSEKERFLVKKDSGVITNPFITALHPPHNHAPDEVRLDCPVLWCGMGSPVGAKTLISGKAHARYVHGEPSEEETILPVRQAQRRQVGGQGWNEEDPKEDVSQ